MTKGSKRFMEALLCTPRDRQHERYWRPLPNMDDEHMAESSASAIYDAIAAEYFTEQTTKEEADQVWEQAMADSRRMICEPEYEAIFVGLN